MPGCLSVTPRLGLGSASVSAHPACLELVDGKAEPCHDVGGGLCLAVGMKGTTRFQSAHRLRDWALWPAVLWRRSSSPCRSAATLALSFARCWRARSTFHLDAGATRCDGHPRRGHRVKASVQFAGSDVATTILSILVAYPLAYILAYRVPQRGGAAARADRAAVLDLLPRPLLQLAAGAGARGRDPVGTAARPRPRSPVCSWSATGPAP